MGNNHKIVSNNYEAILCEPKNLGAENITETRMSVDEIAVQILKNNKA